MPYFARTTQNDVKMAKESEHAVAVAVAATPKNLSVIWYTPRRTGSDKMWTAYLRN